MSANAAPDDRAGTEIADHAMNNAVTLYPIEVCEATIAANETQNPDGRHLRVKGSFRIFASSPSGLGLSLCRRVESDRVESERDRVVDTDGAL